MQDLSIRGEIKSLLNNEPFRDSKTPAGRLACQGVYLRRKFVKDIFADCHVSPDIEAAPAVSKEAPVLCLPFALHGRAKASPASIL